MARILLLLWVIVLIVSVSGKNILSLLSLRGGFSGPSIQLDGEGEFVEIRHSKVSKLDGKYNRDEEDINGRPHFARRLEDDPRGDAIHLYWSGSQWVLHYDTDPSMNFDNLIAYAKIRVANPKGTSTFWHVRKGKAYESAPSLMVNDRASHIEGQERHGQCSGDGVKHEGCVQREQLLGIPHIMGVPQQLFPLYTSFMFDAIATGLAMPLLPFYVMGLGANAFQLSMIVSSNYVAQMIGCLVVGQISDRYGRKLVLSMALFASFLSYLGVSQSTTLTQVTLARIVIGSCGGLVPIIQSGVADVTSDEDRPKYFARIMATYGLGFVLGPALSAILPNVTTKQKLLLASFFPLIGFFIQLLFFKETKQGVAHFRKESDKKAVKAPVSVSKKAPVNPKVLLLLLNGFLLMYAFSIETIYAMFIKDNFGYGERALSTLFACNGVLIGVFQVFFLKHLVGKIGKHWTLIIGSSMLSLGMIGLSLIRNEPIHFTLFVAHIVGYSIADTALASLISKYSTPASQGRDLAYNQAAQACARVISPLVAGLLYEMSKQSKGLPAGALPYLVGAVFPAAGVLVPLVLYTQSVDKKKRILEENRRFEAGEE